MLTEYTSLNIDDGIYRYYVSPQKKITFFRTQEEARAYLVAKLVAEKMENP